jgi:hypothetical protein
MAMTDRLARETALQSLSDSLLSVGESLIKLKKKLVGRNCLITELVEIEEVLKKRSFKFYLINARAIKK